MVVRNFRSIVSDINVKAKTHAIGNLPEIRKQLTGKGTRSNELFDKRSTLPTSDPWYAFHFGGRTELQFNIVMEQEGYLRYGVAFSLETNQTLPDIDILVPKIKLFNDFMQLCRFSG